MKYIITNNSKIIAETHDEELAYDYLNFKIANSAEPHLYDINIVKEDIDIINDMKAIRI